MDYKKTKKQYCEYFGIDDFKITPNYKREIIKQNRYSTHLGIVINTESKSFFGYNFIWSIGTFKFFSSFYPTIKEVKIGINTIYIEDNDALKNKINKLIKMSWDLL